jgi:hypothetical protein
LRAGIARGRSCASILVVPRRKTSLCEALHGRRPWPELELPWEPMGSSTERGKRGKEEGNRGALLGGGMGAARGRHGRGCRRCTLLTAWFGLLWSGAVSEEGNRKEEGEREKKRK